MRRVAGRGDGVTTAGDGVLMATGAGDCVLGSAGGGATTEAADSVLGEAML